MDSPLGRLYVAAGPGGALVRLTYGVREEEFLAELDRSTRNGPAAPALNPGAVAPILRQLDQYFTGARRRFRLEVDLSGLPPFRPRARAGSCPLHSIRARVELRAGGGGGGKARGRPGRRPGAGAKPGGHRHPLPPGGGCSDDGSLHGFTAAGGLEAKRFLLELEGWQQGRLG